MPRCGQHCFQTEAKAHQRRQLYIDLPRVPQAGTGTAVRTRAGLSRSPCKVRYVPPTFCQVSDAESVA